jgi:hypothetical protein
MTLPCREEIEPDVNPTFRRVLMHQQSSYSKQPSPFDLNHQSNFSRSPFDPTSAFDPLVTQWGRSASSHGRTIDESDLIVAQNLIDADPKVREALAKSLSTEQKSEAGDDLASKQSTQAMEADNAPLSDGSPESSSASLTPEKDESTTDLAGQKTTAADIFPLKLPSYSYQWFSPKNPDYYMQKESTTTSQSQVSQSEGHLSSDTSG